MNQELQRKYDFMKFELKKLKELYDYLPGKISNIDAESAFKSFCSQCYHFKDWLIQEFPTKKNDIEQYISSNKWLSICADFTNKDKHRKLSKKSRSENEVEHGNNHTFLNLINSGFVTKSRYEIKFGDKKIDSLEIAKLSFEAWNIYLAKIKLTY